MIKGGQAAFAAEFIAFVTLHRSATSPEIRQFLVA